MLLRQYRYKQTSSLTSLAILATPCRSYPAFTPINNANTASTIRDSNNIFLVGKGSNSVSATVLFLLLIVRSL